MAGVFVERDGEERSICPALSTARLRARCQVADLKRRRNGTWWLRNGREIGYGVGDQIMMVNYSVNGGSFVPEKPRVVIDKLGGGDWGAFPDGKRMVVITPLKTSETPPNDHELTFLLTSSMSCAGGCHNDGGPLAPDRGPLSRGPEVSCRPARGFAGRHRSRNPLARGAHARRGIRQPDSRPAGRRLTGRSHTNRDRQRDATRSL